MLWVYIANIPLLVIIADAVFIVTWVVEFSKEVYKKERFWANKIEGTPILKLAILKRF